MSNALPPFSAKLLSSRPLGGGMRELCLEVPDEFCRASRPGMFVHLKVPDAPQHLLRRPISIMDLEPEDNLLVLGVQPKGEGPPPTPLAAPQCLIHINQPTRQQLIS